MGDITLRKALDDYKTVYMAYRNFAQRTRVEYLNDLQDLARFLEKEGINHVKGLGLPIIERYVAHLEEKGFASLTRKRKVISIRSFLTFLYQDGYIATNIAGKIVLPFTESTVPHVLTKIECDQLRSASAGIPRDRAIIEVILQTGIKLSELVHLTLNDIELENGDKNNGFLRILGGRGKRERMIALNEKACTALNNYLDERKNTENSVLFLNRLGGPLGESGVQKMLRKHIKRAGIGRASIHTLRHTFGVQYLAKGADPQSIQEVMGLKDVRSTSVYLSLAKGVVTREMRENSL